MSRNQESPREPKSDKYVAPCRGGAVVGGTILENAFNKNSDKEREVENTICLSNLTKAVTEEDLRAYSSHSDILFNHQFFTILVATTIVLSGQ